MFYNILSYIIRDPDPHRDMSTAFVRTLSIANGRSNPVAFDDIRFLFEEEIGYHDV